MGDPMSIISAIAGPLLSAALGSGKEKKEKPAPAPAVAPPPQAPKAPDTAALRRQNQGSAIPGGGGTPSSTFLTGPGGVTDTKTGGSTLLGS